MFKEIEIRTKDRVDFVDITSKLKEIVRQSNIEEGLMTVFVPHTTAGITINEHADPSVVNDIKKQLEKLVPANNGYSHSEGNSDAHIKASLIGSSVNIIIRNGEMMLGTWQGVFFCEFDGPRRRKIYVYIK
ncbi:protein of unknown function UPF0047 [Caldicellulosiruptor owensensis OL]|uniref:YjbQ family protein n=1 Tax=Caldicellulosiruptor owensensis (strain ATCC 700167 / DSM 13100 / OL) TaxID=632518 RepID=E4Q232_CALOW|nr:secondary thiamine-phosphate synthase enzyme YjbQ [Caldicellulosiruptor owensensis]ADQ04850.1 protein of unknown function UPF0047 [Caldicellulosiruptor owensensis OL]